MMSGKVWKEVRGEKKQIGLGSEAGASARVREKGSVS